MCLAEALGHAGAVVTGEADLVWPQVLPDVRSGTLQRVYAGGPAPVAEIPPARHDLLDGKVHALRCATPEAASPARGLRQQED